MGKIVKSAHVRRDAYVMPVPRLNGLNHSPIPAHEEPDARFAAAPSDAGAVDEALAETQPAPATTHEIDFETLRSDAEAIVDRAASDAESLIRQAEATALELIAKARAEAVKLADDARASAHQQGYAAGTQAAHDELAPVIAAMREMVESIRQQRAAAIAASEPELVRLAVAVAERILHTELTTNPNVVVENVRQALTRLVSREVVTLRVHPADHDTIRQYRDSIVAASDVEHLRIVEDQRVDRGGVLVETEAGTIDSKIATQLREAKRAILSEEQIALGDEESLRSPAQAS